MAELLLVDNYDSFTYNLAHLFGVVGARVTVVRNDDPSLMRGVTRGYDAIVIGPGPGRPEQAGRTLEIIGECAQDGRPLLGVCLGLQAIGQFFGGTVVHAPSLMHGKTSEIRHGRAGIFADVPSPFAATRYHSLCVAHEGFPAALRVTAASDDGVVQGAEHRELPIYGVQFHPESVLTPQGGAIFRNFLRIAQRDAPASVP